MAHTALPWFVKGRAGSMLCITDAKSRYVVDRFILGAETAQEHEDNAEFIVLACNAHDDLVAALKSIASLGGNLPDASLADRTGPNDARHRGLMYCEARRIAREAIGKADAE